MGQQGGWGDHIPDSSTWWDNIPAKVSSITSAWVGYKSINLAGTTCKGHAAHDMRFVTDPQQTFGNWNSRTPRTPNPDDLISIEWLVQIQNVGQYAAHPGGKDPARYCGQVTIPANSPYSWHVYLQPGAQTTLCQMIPVSYPASNHLNIGAMIAWGRSTKFKDLPEWNKNYRSDGTGILLRRNATKDDPIFDPTSWFISDVIGYEICGAGAVRMEVDSAYLRVNRD
jgi:hypothetical protein